MYSLCLDCGATNVRAMVVDEQGAIVGKASQPNATLPGEENPEFHIWDADRIFRQISECAVKALEGLNAEQVTAATITTFGVDGALVDEAGNLLYPVISWKCPRTAEVMKNIGKYISQEELNRISGVGAFAFNTIYKLVWLKENHPELLEKAHAWLFISNLLAYKLTGIMATDRTMAGTSQLTDLETGDFSEFILNRLSLSRGLFPPIVDAGETIGLLTPEAADAMNLPALAGIPVISAGHDTQFAIFGSGADKNQPVLSSGTWEILMARSAQARLTREDYEDGATAEFDAESGLLNPGLQWLGSGIIEWVKAACFHGESYDTMDAEADAPTRLRRRDNGSGLPGFRRPERLHQRTGAWKNTRPYLPRRHGGAHLAAEIPPAPFGIRGRLQKRIPHPGGRRRQKQRLDPDEGRHSPDSRQSL